MDAFARALLVAADAARARDAVEAARGRATRAGTAPLGTAILDGHESLASLEAPGGRRRASTRGPCSGRQELLENLVNQRDLDGRRRGPRRAGSGRPTELTAVAHVLGIDVVDDRDEGRPDRRGRCGRRGRRRRVRLRGARSRSGASRTRAVVGRRDRARSGPSWRRPASPAIGRRGRRADRPDARRSCCSTRPTRCCGRRSSGTTSGRPHACDEIREAVGAAAAHRDHRQRRAHRVHGAEARLGPRPRARRLGAGRPRPAAEGLRAAAPDRRARDGQGRRRGHAAVRPRGPRLVAGGARRAADRPGLAAADVRGAGGHGHA